MVKTNLLGGIIAVMIVVSLGLTLAVIDQQATIGKYKIPSNGGIRTSALDSSGSWGSAWAAEVQENTLFVSGSAAASADPEKVTIMLSVETDSLSALTSQEENAEKISAVKSAIMAKGIPVDKIETTSYNLDQLREYNSGLRKYDYNGYRTTHTLKIEVTDIDVAGSIIDAGVTAGANNVNSVRFGLTDATMNRLKMEALEAAAINAREKADAIGKGLGISVTRVMSANEGYTYAPSYQNMYAGSADMASGASGIPTDLTPGSISITANLNVVFETA